jgi:putative colanic acid biosynthesis UDP-glucose lipid carrier transferase
MLQIMIRPFKGTQGLLKIAEDYVVGTLALIVCAPIMLLIAVAIRIDSPGPILFRQARIGFNSQPFMIYKFRTMTDDPNDDGSIGTRGRSDPRITRIGKLLRGFSVDELPQLFNVMAGDMSVVGPRPYVPNMLVGNTLFNDSVRQFAARHRIKPGITGWAQANGLRGSAVRTIEGARRSVELDIYYITHWSLWFDIKIMLRTVLVLVGRDVF